MFTLLTVSMGACAVYDEHAVEVTSQSAAAAAVSSTTADDASIAPSAAEIAPPTCVALTEVDPCDALPRMAAAPVIDGTLECGLTLHAWPLANAAGAAKVSYAAAWSDAGFYVFIEVHAPPSPARTAAEPLYCGDSLELFVDSDGQPGANGGYNAPGTMQFVVAAPQPGESGPNTGRFLAGLSQGPWISSNLEVAPLADGYALEALIVGPDLGWWSWQPQAQLGFNLALNVAGAGEPRSMPCTTGIGQNVLRVAAAEPAVGCDGKPWCDTRSFCWPGLGP
jgi:hypothetical protein